MNEKGVEGSGRKRDRNADLIRCVAVYSVLSVHFLLNSGFYSVPVTGTDMLVMCMVRSLFMTCVPLFLLLTGYLMSHKTLSRRYYRGIWKTVEIYVLASIACLLFKKFWLENDVTLRTAVLDILDFDGANYAWYIEMYIGLFLMIPFLNLAYNGLKSKREKQVLVWTMIAITMLPKLLNNFDFRTPGWWGNPSASTKYDPLVPGFFTAMYPVTYYFIGAYLREFGRGRAADSQLPGVGSGTVRLTDTADGRLPGTGSGMVRPSDTGSLRTDKLWLRRAVNLLLLVLAVAVLGCYNFWRSDGGSFVWAANSTWGGENLITAYLEFSFLLSLRLDRLPRALQAIMTYISKISLGIYLISWIFDKLIYALLKTYVLATNDRWPYYFIVVPSVFLCSMAGASLLYLIQWLLRGMTGRIRHRGKK